MDDAEPTTYDAGPLAALAYELALRGLGQQEASLAELRERTGTLLTAASLLVTFLGALAIDREGLGVLAVLALVAYAVAGGLCVWILIPKRHLIVRLSGPELYEREYGLPLPEIHRRLAYWNEEYAVGNQTIIGQLQVAFRLAAVALLAEAVLWGVHLAGVS
jgi:hypothetical protein